MTPGALALALLLAQGHGTRAAAAARGTTTASAAEAPKRAAETKADGKSDSKKAGGGDGAAAEGKAAGGDGTAGGKTMKTKTYNFGAMDVEGKLKTPQLLYFLNRVKLELDMSAPDKRSFMKELEKSADDKNL
jgi:hypothetical protein